MMSSSSCLVRGIGFHRPVMMVVLLWFALIGSGVAGAADAPQAAADWKTLSDLTNHYVSDLLSQSTFQKQGQAFIDDWKAWRGKFEPFFKQFTERYGTSYDQVTKAFEGVTQPLDVNQDIGSLYNSASNIDLVAQEKQIVQWAADLGRESYQRWSGLKDPDTSKMELKFDYADRAVRYFTLAAELDPQGDYASFIEQANAAREQSNADWQKVLKDLTWPGHNPQFAGPGDPDALAAAALDYLKQAESWSRPEYDDEHIPIAACVTAKDWEVYKTTALGAPTQYSLDCFVAFKGTQDPNIAYGYHMVFYTREDPGVEKAPPFRYANSQQYAKYKMLMANVPAMRGGGGGMAGAGGSSVVGGGSLIGWLLRLILAAALIVAGLLAASTVVKAKTAALNSAYDKLSPMTSTIGLILLIVGLVCFLRALLHLAPLADLLPQILAVGLGLTLARDVILRQPVAATEGAEAAPATVDFKSRSRQKLDQLATHQAALGLACLVLGVLHLLLGGLPLL